MHGFHVVDLEAWEIERTVDMPGLENGEKPPCETKYPFTIDHGVEITPDERYIIFLCTTGKFAAIYSYPDLKLVKRINVGKQPSYLTISSDSKLAYISCRADCAVHVVSLETLETIHILERAGAFPHAFVLTTDGSGSG